MAREANPAPAHCPAEFSSNPSQKHIKILIDSLKITGMCVEVKLKLNFAGAGLLLLYGNVIMFSTSREV